MIIKHFYRKTCKDAWLIGEEPQEARDNGYHFFQYMVQNQPNQKCFYAIKKKSIDYKKVKKYGLHSFLEWFIVIPFQRRMQAQCGSLLFYGVNGIFSST